MSFEDLADDERALEKHERRIVRCRSCNARIIFLETSTGKKMPVDADTVEPGDELFDGKRHTSHFASCPNANQHRKARGASLLELVIVIVAIACLGTAAVTFYGRSLRAAELCHAPHLAKDQR